VLRRRLRLRVSPAVFHVAIRADWDAARAVGRYEVSSRGRTLADEGFIHASTHEQLAGTLERYYGDLDPAALVILELDVDALDAAGSPVRYEHVAGARAPFPHVYGPIPAAAVIDVHPVAQS
jgi:uncharacterized protein (DUF952 family)